MKISQAVGVFALSLLLPPLAAQNVNSSVKGVVVDTSGSVVPRAACTLVNPATGFTRTTETQADGSFVILEAPPGKYNFSVRAEGFKALTIAEVVLTASEVRTLGTLTLDVGGVNESVTVTAQGAPVQLSSSERSGLVTGQQLSDIAVRGRDFVSYLTTMTGVVDTGSNGREALTRNALDGVHINGGRTTQTLMTIDGIPSMDSGNNGTPNEPNMDSIAEVKVLSSNYQAEFGRNGGGQVAVITKSGTKLFQGSAYNFYRHESLNANTFFGNRTNTPKQAYRYRISGYSLGGPVFVPKKFNTNKDKLFFFFSQELVGSRVNYATQFVNMPTELERNGDFSRSFDVSGNRIAVRDPVAGAPFPGNVIPRNRINALGQSMLNIFPLPNFTDPDPRNLYRRNYRATYSAGWPRRQEVGRLDANISPSFQVYYRVLNDTDNRYTPWGSWVNGSINYFLTEVVWSRPARTHAVHATNILSPTLVNDITFGKVFNGVFTWAVDEASIERGRIGNVPQWYKDSDASMNWQPNITFGGQPTSPVNGSLDNALPNHIPNTMYTLTENLSKIQGSHNLKVGIYFENNRKVQGVGVPSRGTFDFSRDTNNPFDSGHSYANAVLGNFRSYTESDRRAVGDYRFTTLEWYVQDNWRVNRRLTLDFGLRFYHLTTIADKNQISTTLDPRFYDPAKAPALYMPARDSANRRVARDPRTGALAAPPLIGLYVPGSGDYANGARVAGKDGYPAGLFTVPSVAFGPRIGFAFDVFGNGKTAVRGGFGMFKDRVFGNSIINAYGPPAVNSPALFYSNLDTFAQSAGVLGPSNSNMLLGDHDLPSVMNFSFALQHQIRTFTFDVSYVGALSRHLMYVINMNPIPMYARFDPGNADPTQPGSPLPDNFFRRYPGYGNVNWRNFGATSNYHSLQASVNRRFAQGLQLGVAYTFGKALAVAENDLDGVSPYFPMRSWSYGPASWDRTHTFVLNYIYELPKIGARTGFRPAGWFLDNWQVSGITSFISGAPFTPTFGTVDGADITGSTEGARIIVTGDPNLPESERDFYRNFRTEVFQRPPSRSFGNAGEGILRGPGMNNWDIAVSKRVPLFSEQRYIRFRAELFNAWNHTQFTSLYTGARFDRTGAQVDPNFGAYSGAAKPRNIQLSLRLVF